MHLDVIQNQLASLSNAGDGAFLQRFFKTGPGQYGEGDLFRGIRVPVLRRLSKAYHDIPLELAERLLHSTFHEDRLLALLILVRKYASAGETERAGIYTLYLCNTRFINNWDLVDASAEHIVGTYLIDKSRKPLYNLARSSSLWERRIAILATFHFIKRGSFDETLRIAGMLLTDKQDLIHKAVGWMLRETGKRDMQREEAFLGAHYRQMPRTMLRYAIEKFPQDKRLSYLKGTVSPDIRESASVIPCPSPDIEPGQQAEWMAATPGVSIQAMNSSDGQGDDPDNDRRSSRQPPAGIPFCQES
jgi:3-methyladenine DNA glycosylase AlkD